MIRVVLIEPRQRGRKWGHMRAVLDQTQPATDISSPSRIYRRLPRPALPTLLALALAVAAFVAAAVVGVNVFDRLPHVEDELAFAFQAKTIASSSAD